MPYLALMTFGILRAPYRDSSVRGFVDRLDSVFGAADAADGLVMRYCPEHADGAFGPWATPRFVAPELFGREAQTLSFWRDVDAAAAFAYRETHLEALRRRREWFLPPAWPTHAAWWTERVPTWSEAVDRLEHLHDHGPSLSAFPLHLSFDPSGQPARSASERVTSMR